MLKESKKLFFIIITCLLAISAIVISAELMVRFLKPQATLYPRWQYSAEYGAVLYKNTEMVHSMPGKWQFTYKINSYGYRGPLIPISNKYKKNNIVILGDSYAFGTGVNDGEEFSAIMQNRLRVQYDIINLSCGGYGLTQEIRRYYEFGQLYFPKFVILQFSANDPDDNLMNCVTKLEGGRFSFYNTTDIASLIKKYVSSSIIQKSQLYNFIRQIGYIYYRDRFVDNASNNINKEKFYNDLLEIFAKDLFGKGSVLIMISVNKQLNSFPDIKRKVDELNKERFLSYIDIEPWFENVTDYGTPEGHGWGKKAHYIIGNNLSNIILTWGITPTMQGGAGVAARGLYSSCPPALSRNPACD